MGRARDRREGTAVSAIDPDRRCGMASQKTPTDDARYQDGAAIAIVRRPHNCGASVTRRAAEQTDQSLVIH